MIQPISVKSFRAHQPYLNSGSQQATPEALFAQGCQYLDYVRQLALWPEMVEFAAEPSDRQRMYEWLGQHAPAVNATLNAYLMACHQCFETSERQPMQVFAAPLAPELGIDGFCNIWTQPATILIDIGRIPHQDWLCAIAHEYAHAHIGVPGHGQSFKEVLQHLCLGLGIALPLHAVSTSEQDLEGVLRTWPRGNLAA